LDVVFEKALSRRSTNRIVNSFASSPPQPNPASDKSTCTCSPPSRLVGQ